MSVVFLRHSLDFSLLFLLPCVAREVEKG